MSDKQHNFKFFVPANVTKAKDEDGNEEMFIEGIASTGDEDADGEMLQPAGYDLGYFKQYGLLNWQHGAKSDPNKIVGAPVEAEVRDNKFWLKGKLFNGNTLAKGIYHLAKELSSAGTGQRLGFSIEGKALERDPLNPKIVKRAKITGVAITPTPKNANTFLDICKGEYVMDDEEAAQEGEEWAHGSKEEFDADLANGGKNTLLDITTPEGTRIIILKDYSTKILPAKALSTTSGAALIPEDVEGETKNISESVKKRKKKEVSLTKGEVYDTIYNNFPNIDLEMADKVFNFIEQVQEHDNK